MKILFLSHKFYPAIGGIEVNSEILAGAFKQAGHEVHLLTWTEEKGDKDFPYQVVRNPSLSVLLTEHKWADVVYENNPCLRLSWPGLFIKSKSVIALRTWINRMDGTKGWQDKVKSVWLDRADKVIAVSEAVRKRCWPEAVVIGNPYREDLFDVMPDIDRDKDFVYLGRLVSDKGVDLALSAFEKIIRFGSTEAKSRTMTVIGDGPELAALKARSIQMGIEKQVNFTGSLKGETLVKELNRHKYLLVPSIWEEPFGNVALEGMACGCVPIVSDGGGLPDAVGNAGLIFKRGNEPELIAAMQKLLVDKDFEQQLRINATAHLENHYPNKVAGRYLTVIEEAYNKK
jgi:glycosyltransferase involved in cell wall biosynthesis